MGQLWDWEKYAPTMSTWLGNRGLCKKDKGSLSSRWKQPCARAHSLESRALAIFQPFLDLHPEGLYLAATTASHLEYCNHFLFIPLTSTHVPPHPVLHKTSKVEIQSYKDSLIDHTGGSSPSAFFSTSPQTWALSLTCWVSFHKKPVGSV